MVHNGIKHLLVKDRERQIGGIMQLKYMVIFLVLPGGSRSYLFEFYIVSCLFVSSRLIPRIIVWSVMTAHIPPHYRTCLV